MVKVAITGGTSGVGFEACKQLCAVAEVTGVVLTSRTSAKRGQPGRRGARTGCRASRPCMGARERARPRWAAGAARSAHRVPGVPPPLPMGETLISHYYILNEPSFEIFLSRGGLSE